MTLADLSNKELLLGLHALVGQGRIVLARMLAHLGEVEERRLNLQSACSSLFDFCVRRRQRGYESEMALRGLTAMGFKEPQARRALGIIEGHWDGQVPSMETALRQTLSILT